jgi:prepilin-type N-terminal cleavage/methylation domain-containing protein
VKHLKGFTLIELMISLVIASLLVIMLLSIFARVSFAYREQQKIVSIQRLLSAGREAFVYDAQHAGLQMSQGFTLASDHADGNLVKRSPVRVVNSSTGPDAVGFYYADASQQALVTSTGAATTLTIDANPGFTAGELVVLSTADTTSTTNPVSLSDAKLTAYTACVLQVESVTATGLTFAQTGAWGMSDNTHCIGGAIANASMIYKFVAHYWRIDESTEARQALGALQLDATGALGGIADANFTDQAYGVVDLQLATYVYDGDGVDTADPDADGDREWLSSGDQDTATAAVAVASPFAQVPLAMTISIVARTDENVEGVYTRASPNLTVATNTSNNTVGDHASFALPDASEPAYAGYHVYRYISFGVDFRNLGIGR